MDNIDEAAATLQEALKQATAEHLRHHQLLPEWALPSEAALDVLAAAAADGDKPNLGLATTGQLLDELRARAEVDGTIGYRTVDSLADDGSEHD
jgi:hypothetical protein